jgi:hypothetical protein
MGARRRSEIEIAADDPRECVTLFWLEALTSP